MKSWILGTLTALAATAALVLPAQAAVVHGVTITKGQGWVRVSVNAPGAAYHVHEMPVGSAAYRSIAIDVPNSYIVGGLEPKNQVPVNEGLVAQVRVKQMSGFVRVYVDVVSFPKYQTGHDGGQFVLGMDAYHMRSGNPIAPQMR